LQLRPFAFGLICLACLLFASRIVAAQGIDCQGGFNIAKEEYEKRGMAVQAANKRKASAQEACGLFKSLVDAQGKLLKFLTDNKTACNIPDELVKNLGSNHTKTVAVKTQVCTIAANGGAAAVRPPSSGLSGAINITGEVGAAPPENGGGLFDTLNGNILQR